MLHRPIFVLLDHLAEVVDIPVRVHVEDYQGELLRLDFFVFARVCFTHRLP